MTEGGAFMWAIHVCSRWIGTLIIDYLAATSRTVAARTANPNPYEAVKQ